MMRRGRAPNYRDRLPDRYDRHTSRAASRAQDALLMRLWNEQGKSYRTVCQAIEDGLLTDLDWCEELSRQREVWGVADAPTAEAQP